MNNLINNILFDIVKYENNNLNVNIKNRLESNLKNYLANLNNYYNIIRDQLDEKYTIKELQK